MNNYKIYGMSYQFGMYKFCGVITAKSVFAAKLKARKVFDNSNFDGFGYSDFLIEAIKN
jgi:hypothetical protein